MIRAGRQVRIEESIEGTLEHDSRPPVLFLRPFASERAPFVQGPLSRYGQYATQGPRWVTKLRTSPDESPNDVISALRAGSWRELADTVGKLGLDLGDDPGPGAVITFDADAKAIVLATGAEAPIEFIQPVHAHLINTFWDGRWATRGGHGSARYGGSPGPISSPAWTGTVVTPGRTRSSARSVSCMRTTCTKEGQNARASELMDQVLAASEEAILVNFR